MKLRNGGFSFFRLALPKLNIKTTVKSDEFEVAKTVKMSHVVLGGGISGLSAAYYLSKSVPKGIKVYESSNRVGGWIKSIRTKNGAVFEQGPRLLRYRGNASENSLKLIEELNLKSSIKCVSKLSEAAKNRMIYFNNELIDLPASISVLFKVNPPIFKPLIFGIWKDIITPKKVVEDESIYDFVSRRFGKDYAEILFGALTCGTFAGDVKEISVKALLNDIFKKEQEYGGVIRGLLFGPKVKKLKDPKKEENKYLYAWSLKGGLETLALEMENYLEQSNNVEILLEKKCTSVAFKNREALITINGNVEPAQHLYSSLSSKDLSQILGEEHSFLKSELSSIPFVSVAVVNLEYEGDLLEKQCFGFLVPPNQNLPILGVIFSSCIFPQKGLTVLTVMMGGKWFEHHFGPNPKEEFLLKIAKDHIKKILKIDKEPTSSLVTILKDCLPQYIVGHSKTVEGIREYIAKHKLPLTLVGYSFDGIGVNDAILSAKKGVENALK